MKGLSRTSLKEDERGTPNFTVKRVIENKYNRPIKSWTTIN